LRKQDMMMNLAEMVQAAEASDDIMFSNKAAWYKVSGYCTFYNSDNVDARPMYYLACTACKKKVNDEAGGFRCENC